MFVSSLFLYLVSLVLNVVCSEFYVSQSKILKNHNLEFLDISGIHPSHYYHFKKGDWVGDKKQKWYEERFYYRLSRVDETIIESAPIPVSECIKCPINTSGCLISQRYFPQVTVEKEGNIKIPTELLRYLSRNEISYTAKVPHIINNLTLSSGYAFELTFTPYISFLTAKIELCIPTGDWHWPWQDEDYECSVFYFYQRTPITQKETPAFSSGAFLFRGC
ncbi:hypothetical protein DSO57_1015724 [Entomophthora muscae]|uniref:Uncharacterized protein n=1 Tax=Entomophthora muscae TaxID=34485 RepID=A0ACC2RWI7_9FUNG|nr:hypothetical protein DSO57_1015724 [Entomophthora muscae]